MKDNTKKVIAIHDLAGFGRCSLSVIIPTLAAMGVQPCAAPTALLSTHTGGFDKFTFLDLTDELKKIEENWKEYGIDFDAVYSGFLANSEQIHVVSQYIDDFVAGKIVMVDPVMGDNGELYSTYNKELCDGMRELVKKATVITPNITEAAILLGREYKKRGYKEKEIYEMLEKLASMGPKQVVITGITDENEVSTAYFDIEKNDMGVLSNKRIGKDYPGTGDIFASALLGYLLNGKTLREASRRASDFIYDLTEYSGRFDYNEREGVLLEPLLYKLIKEKECEYYE